MTGQRTDIERPETTVKVLLLIFVVVDEDDSHDGRRAAGPTTFTLPVYEVCPASLTAMHRYFGQMTKREKLILCHIMALLLDRQLSPLRDFHFQTQQNPKFIIFSAFHRFSQTIHHL